MKLLLNDKEIAHFLNDNMKLDDKLDHLHIVHTQLSELAFEHKVKMKSKKVDGKSAREYYDKEQKKKFADKLKRAIARDLSAFTLEVKEFLQRKREYNFQKIHKNIESIIDTLGKEYIIELYKNSNYQNFIKSTGLNLDKNAVMMRRKEFTNYQEDCLIRNTVGNEELLVTKIDKKYPMWFIDSGYTNFLEPNKKWHRLVRNHLHYGEFFDAPMSRLENFPKFPVPWRRDGDAIYVIEPGPFAASIFHCDLKTWKYDVEAELRKHTDKKIKFREKAPKRERTRLFDELLNEDYYCVVSINSNAATEAIWAGVPAITLGTHITNPVTRNKLSDINDLFYGNLGSWLAMLSYSQFTKDELMNGTARKLIGKYHRV
jgi:hypothetical protein